MRAPTLLLAATLLAPSVLAAQGPDRYRLTIGTVDSLKSTVLNGETRKYLVYTPPSYSDTVYTPQRYPVLYLLDGDAHFHSVTGIIQILGTGVNATYAVPEMIVVAIPNTNRLRDMSPTKVTTGLDGKPAPGMASSGGMGNFLSMIKTELIPAIDAKYRTSPYRVFVGHSLGGITVIQALYTMPETFNAYIAIDPEPLVGQQGPAQAGQGSPEQGELLQGEDPVPWPGEHDESRRHHDEPALQRDAAVQRGREGVQHVGTALRLQVLSR
jgi:enterochelin esterase-like enzyme